MLFRNGKKRSRLLLAAGLAVLLYPLVAWALEISQIPEAQEKQVKCRSQEYIGIGQPPPMGNATLPLGPCQQSCKSAVSSAVNQANGALQGAKAKDQAINASAAGQTAAQAGAVTPKQESPQFGTAAVNSSGVDALLQQQALAQMVSSSMKTCSSQIKSACSGALAQEDKAAADESAQSCEQSGTQADQVAAEKGAKAGEMAKNQNKSDQNGQGMSPPQMAQGGDKQAGEPSGLDKKSGVSSNLQNPSSSSLGSGKSANGVEMQNAETQETSGGSGDPSFSRSASIPGGITGSADPGSSSFESQNSSGSSSSPSLSGGSGLGFGASLPTPSKGVEEGAGRKENGDEEGIEAIGALGAPPGGRSTLGLKTSGSDFEGLNGPDESSGVLGGFSSEEDSEGGRGLADSDLGRIDDSLFFRIRRKITQVSGDLHMQ